MKNFMNSIRINRNDKNVFDLTHSVVMSLKFGNLYPSLAMEVLPNQKVRLGCDSLVRFNPMVFATMWRFKTKVEYYFVPNRLCWKNWEAAITHQASPPSAPPVMPFINVFADGSNYLPLMDYMGIPKPLAGQTQNEQVDAIPFMAYQKVWDTFYRQDYIIPSLKDVWGVTNDSDVTLLDGDNGSIQTRLTVLRKRAWEHDYFTSCLPTPQHGVPVEIPISMEDAGIKVNSASTHTITAAPGNLTAVGQTTTETTADLYVEGSELDNSTTIEDLRRASAIQRFFERLMRTGRRYKEVILAAFGSDTGDARLQRPEFIFSTSSPIVISEVLNTTGTVDAPQGAIAGHGIGVNSGYSQWYTAKEHGWIIGVLSVIPDSGYFNGLERKFFRKTHFDYFWPEFANLGEEAIQKREVLAYQTIGAETFGYLPRYSRYRTQFNRVCGQFRTTMVDFHFARVFDTVTPPVLNQDFIECTPGKRIFAVTDPNEDDMQAMVVHKILSISPVPKYGTPMLS